MIRFILFFCMAVPLISCSDPESLKKEAEEKLEARYGEEFDILSFNEVVLEQPRYEFTARPRAKPGYVFELTMTKENHVVIDNYLGMRWVYEATEELKNYISPRYPKTAALVEPHLKYLETASEKSIPSFQTALNNLSEEDEVYVTVYFFTDYTDSTKQELFAEIRNIISFYQKENIPRTRFSFQFYDQQYFRDVNTDSLHYCFEGRVFHYPDCFETRYLKQGRHSISLDITAGQPTPDDSFLESEMVDWSTLDIR